MKFRVDREVYAIAGREAGVTKIQLAEKASRGG
jgi:hypothetical protein